MIGSSAGYSTISQSAVIIGHEAGYDASYSDHTIFIGKDAGYEAKFDDYGIYIGYGAGKLSGDTSVANEHNDYSIGIGTAALQSSTGLRYSLGIGGNALQSSSGINSLTCVGHSAGYACHDNEFGLFMGYRAGHSSHGTPSAPSQQNIGLGRSTLETAKHCNYVVAIGAQAGYQIENVDNSIFIGNNAGQNLGRNYDAGDGHLIIRTKGLLGASDAEEPSWQETTLGTLISDSDDTFKGGLIDIATIIQGKSDNNNDLYLKIGKDLGDFSSDTRKKEILKNNTLSIMSTKTTDTALKLCQNREQQSGQGQNSSLLLAETFDGGLHQNDNYEVIDRNGHFKLQVYPKAEWIRMEQHGDVQDSSSSVNNLVYTSEWQIKDANNRIVNPEVGRMVLVESVYRTGNAGNPATFQDYVFVGTRRESGSLVWKMLPWAL